MDYIVDAFEGQPLTVLNNRAKYLVNTLTDHVPATSPEFLHQVTDELVRLGNFADCDLLVGEEDRGGYITAVTAYLVRKSFTLVKWNPLGLVGETSFEFRNAYAEGSMYLNGVRAGERAIIVEDFIDTGGTIIALINLLRNVGATVVEALAVVEKVDHNARQRIFEETGIVTKSLVSVTAKGTVSKVVGRHRPG